MHYSFWNSEFYVACATVFSRMNYNDQIYGIVSRFLYEFRVLGAQESPLLS